MVTTKQNSRADTQNTRRGNKQTKKNTENHQTKMADRNSGKRNKGNTEQPENKVLSAHLSVITLSVNGLNLPVTDTKWLDRLKK